MFLLINIFFFNKKKNLYGEVLEGRGEVGGGVKIRASGKM
jgi:hypothetical protein